MLRAMRIVASNRDPGDPEAAPPRRAPVHRDPDARDPHARRRRILLIEDDAELREAMQETLALRGHEVVPAGNGRDALREMRLARPDLVILDLMMPVMDGWQFRAELKRDPALADVPIVVISGNDSATVTITNVRSWIRPKLVSKKRTSGSRSIRNSIRSIRMTDNAIAIVPGLSLYFRVP